MKNIFIIVLLCLVACNVYSQSNAKLVSSQKLPANIIWEWLGKVKNDVYALGRKNESVYLYSSVDKKAKNITKYFASDQVYMVGEMLIENTAENQYVVYSFDGKRIKNLEMPKIGERMSAKQYFANNEYYFGYKFHTLKKHPNPGVVRLSDKKIIYEYDEWGIGYSFPSFVFLKDCFIVNEKSDYVMKIYDYNKTLLREIKHPTFKRSEYSTEEKVTPYPQLQEVYNKGPFYPQIIEGFFFANNRIIVVRRRRPSEKTRKVDVFNFENGKLLKTVSLIPPVQSKIPEYIADDYNIIVLLNQGNVYYLNIYKL